MWSEPSITIDGFKYEDTSYFYSDNIREDEITIKFYVNSEAEIFELKPTGIIVGLTQIGGLIALLKVGSVLSYFHFKLYSRSLRDYITSDNKLKNPP